MNLYLTLKALHLISVISWFAGLFYIVRLFIYHVEAEQRPAAEKAILQTQFNIMQRRLWYGITWPAMVATVIFGTALMLQTQAYTASWLHLKLLFVFMLVGYHLYCGSIRKNLITGRNKLSSKQLRLWNEVPTLFMFAIVFIAVSKMWQGLGLGLGIFFAMGVLLMLGLKVFCRKNDIG